MTGDDPSGFAADLGQHRLIERSKAVLSHDTRVVGVWLIGSFGRATNDRFSDVDLLVVVDPDQVDDFCDAWPELSDEIAPTVFRSRRKTLFNQITTDWRRFDVSVATPNQLTHRTRSTVKPVFDPTGLSAGLGEPAPPEAARP